jgi:hypothetical protein
LLRINLEIKLETPPILNQFKKNRVEVGRSVRLLQVNIILKEQAAKKMMIKPTMTSDKRRSCRFRGLKRKINGPKYLFTVISKIMERRLGIVFFDESKVFFIIADE